MIGPWKRSCKLLKESLVAEEQGIRAGRPTKHSYNESESHSVESNSLRPHGLCSPWNSRPEY